MSNVFVIIKMCYVHNQWYDISCATLYIHRTKLTMTFGHSAQDSEQTDMKSRMESKIVRNVRERATKENKEE